MRNPVVSFARRTARQTIRKLGYEVVKSPYRYSGQAYGPILPTATYTPWNLDEEFLKVYAAIKEATLIDVYRCWELWTLTEQAAKVPGSLIEVGTWRGGSGALIAARARQGGLTDPVYLCDTFRGVVKTGPRDPVYTGGEHADTSRGLVEALVFDTLKLDNVRILEGIFPDETGPQVEGERFRLCHIDVDVYESARGVVEWIDARMGVGSIYVYDDYGNMSTAGITRLVDEQGALPDRVVLYNLNGHAVVIRIA
ncbi:TylF/MycF family methyltransferase [bacterium]|nr:TylF/MycF family methyltransferase [bacterium]